MSADACAFLDRDGTIIEERHYLGDPEGVVLERGAAEGLAQLAAAGYRLVVVSNQSGVGRGIITAAQVDAVNQRVDALLRESGVRIAAWYACPHSPSDECDCRKPRPGLLDQAVEDLGIDLTRSVLIGDKDIDLQLAEARGLEGHLVLTGHGDEHAGWARDNGFRVHADIGACAAEIAAASRSGLR